MLDVHAEMRAGLHKECLLLLCDFNGLWNFAVTPKNQMLYKICSLVLKLLYADRHMLNITGAYLQLFIMNKTRMDCIMLWHGDITSLLRIRRFHVGILAKIIGNKF
jgi:hypothetical protein